MTKSEVAMELRRIATSAWLPLVVVQVGLGPVRSAAHHGLAAQGRVIAWVVTTEPDMRSRVVAVDTKAGRSLGRIKVGCDPRGAIVSKPDGTAAFVRSCARPHGGQYLADIDTITGTALHPIRLPDGIAFLGSIGISANGQTVYVGVPHGVVAVSTLTGAVSGLIPTGDNPGTPAVTPNGKTAYILDVSGKVTPILTASNKALRPIAVGNFPSAIAITPNGRTAYVTNQESKTVTPFTTATNR